MELSHLLTFLLWTAGGFLNMVTGMGGALICLPVMSCYLEIPVIVAVISVMATVSCALVALRFRKDMRWGTMPSLLIGSVPGLLLGVWILKTMPGRWLGITVGVTLIAYTLWQLRLGNIVRPRRESGKVRLAAGGFAASVALGAVGLGGPPMVVLAYLDGWDKDFARGLFGAYFSVTGMGSMLVYWWQDLYTPVAVTSIMWALPGLLLGMLIGLPVAARIRQGAFTRLLLLIVLGGGVTLLVRSLGS